MSVKPEDISDSAWQEARAAYAGNGVASEYEHTLYVYERIARAIMAATERERERAAMIAEEQRVAWLSSDYQGGFNDACNTIAAAIRQGSQPSNAIPLKGVVR